MWFIIDALLILIIVFCAVLSAKRGFVRAAVEVLGGIAVITLCISLSTPVAETVYEKTIENSIIRSVSENIEKSVEKTSDTVWQALPKIATKGNGLSGVSKEALQSKIDLGEESAEKIAVSAVNIAVRPVIVRILSLTFSIVSIIILLFVVRLIARMLNRVFSFSILGYANRILGGILGVLKGILYCVVFVIVITFLISVTKSTFGIFTENNIEKTYIFKIIYGALPFSK